MAKLEVNFTKKALDDLPLPATASTRTETYDANVSGLIIRVTSTGAKTFQVLKRANGVLKRVTLGRYPGMTIER